MNKQSGKAVLTAADVLVLARIVEAAQRECMVQRVNDDVPDGFVVGTVRHLVTSSETYATPGAGDDIRDCLLRVTLRGGLDVCWPVPELMEQLRAGEARFSN